MVEREERSQEFEEFENQLGELIPRPQTLDRASLLFQAGQEVSQAARRRGRNRERCWQAIAIVLLLVACGTSWNARQSSPQIVERVRYLPTPDIVEALPDHNLFAMHDRNRNHYLRRRYVALTDGLDQLDGPTSMDRFDPFDNRSYRDLMNEYLEHGED